MSNIFIFKKAPTEKVNRIKPTNKVDKFRFKNLKKLKPVKFRFGTKNTFEDIL